MSRFAQSVFAILALLFAGSAIAASGGEGCTAVAGPPGIGPWFVSAAQTGGGDLIILDPIDNELLWMAPGATVLTRLTGPAADALPEARAVQVRAIPPDDLLLELVNPRSITPLDRGFNLRLDESWNVIGSHHPDGRTILSTWIWETLGADKMVACSDLSGSGRPDAVSLVRVERGSPSGFEILLERPRESRLNLACRLSLPLITTLSDGSIYALVPGGSTNDKADRQTRIYRVAPGGKRAAPLGAPVGEWPIEPLDVRWDKYPWVMREFELATTPMGLFGHGQWLYLLSRSPLGSATQWSLTRIDPRSGTAAGTMRISSRASHVMVVPGEDRWAWIEKGPVQSFGAQELRRILWMPVVHLDHWRDGGILCPGS